MPGIQLFYEMLINNLLGIKVTKGQNTMLQMQVGSAGRTVNLVSEGTLDLEPFFYSL